MTRSELIAALLECGSDEAHSEAKIILEELFGIPYSKQMADISHEYDTKALLNIIERRKKHEPLQYIIGHAYFCNEKYILNEDCLIPRSDTELIVYKAAEALGAHASFADLCTGSGCIAISLLALRPDIRGVALDISENAIKAAKENSELNGVSERLCLSVADVFNSPLGSQKFDAILSNPPYIPTSVISSLTPEVKSEPRRALDGGDDGMDFYRFIVANYKKNLKKGGFFLFEIGYDQEQSIIETATRQAMACRVFRDMSRNPRAAIIYFDNQEPKCIH